MALDGLTVDGARDRIRGPKGSVVTLTVLRGTDEPFPLEITRDVIQQEEVESRDLAGGTVGYVRLNGFSDRGADELEAALQAHVERLIGSSLEQAGVTTRYYDGGVQHLRVDPCTDVASVKLVDDDLSAVYTYDTSDYAVEPLNRTLKTWLRHRSGGPRPE